MGLVPEIMSPPGYAGEWTQGTEDGEVSARGHCQHLPVSRVWGNSALL